MLLIDIHRSGEFGQLPIYDIINLWADVIVLLENPKLDFLKNMATVSILDAADSIVSFLVVKPFSVYNSMKTMKRFHLKISIAVTGGNIFLGMHKLESKIQSTLYSPRGVYYIVVVK